MLQTEAQVEKGEGQPGGFVEIRNYLTGHGFDYLEKARVQKNIDDKQGHTDVAFINLVANP